MMKKIRSVNETMNRKPMMCLKLNETENNMLEVLSEDLQMCKSEVLRYLIRREYERVNKED